MFKYKITAGLCVVPGYINRKRAIIEVEFKDKKLSITGEIPSVTWGQCHDSIKAWLSHHHLQPYDVAILLDIWEKHHLNDMHAGCEHQDTWPIKKVITEYRYCMGPNLKKLEDNILGGCCATIQEYVAMVNKIKASKYWIYESEYAGPPEMAPISFQEHLKDGYIAEWKKETKTAGWVPYQAPGTDKGHPDGLLCKPCDVCGHKYGSKWLFRPVPDDIVEWLRQLKDVYPTFVKEQ